jgi:histidine triad (HIT) family protein
MQNCIFCKIAKNELEAYKIFENERVLCFLDIAPIADGHILVMPKEHFESVNDMPENEYIDLMKAIKKAADIIHSRLNTHYNIICNNGSRAGQIIPHVHFHILPRRDGDMAVAYNRGDKKSAEYFISMKSKLEVK